MNLKAFSTGSQYIFVTKENQIMDRNLLLQYVNLA